MASARTEIAPTRFETERRGEVGRRMLNKVPEVTLYFWVIKVLCTTVGETAADYLDGTLGLGLSKTTYVMSAVLILALVWQFRLRAYVPFVYWLAVVLISIVGTLITDNLTDNFGVSLVITTIVFSIALAVTFARLVRGRADAVDPHDRHDPARGASTGWRCCSPSRSAPRRAT